MFDHVWIILHLHILFMFLIFQTIHRAAYFSPTQSFLSQWGEPIFLRRLGVSVSKYLGTIWNYDCGINHETSWLMITILIILNPFTYASWTTHCVSTGIAEALGVGVQCVGPTSGGGCLIGSPPSPVGATYPSSIHPPIVRLHTPPSRSQKTIRQFFRMVGEWRAPFQDFQGHSNQ